MLISTENFQQLADYRPIFAAVDSETTGLCSFKDDHLFSIILSDDQGDFYLNFLDYPNEGIEALPKEYIEKLKPRFEHPDTIWFLQNAKFDMHMLARDGIFIKGKVYDLMFLDRIHHNQHRSYRLADITKRWGDEKLDIVWNYITENKLITKTELPEFGKTIEQPHFDKVPFSIIQPYGEQDGRGTLNVGLKILNTIKSEDAQLHPQIPPQMQVVENEARLVHTLFRMEQRGVQLDIPYCQAALKHYFDILKDVELKFKNETGLDFVKGTSVFEEVFVSEKDKWEKTEKGNWRWDASLLETFENPVASLAIQWAEAKKQSEYFANFLYYCDSKGVLHPDFQQSGTVTGRLSCRDPNLQNLTNPDKYDEETEASLYPVRRAFIPRPGFFFAMIDYSQSEFRLTLDYANAHSLIKEVLKGHDVHTATANIANVSRKEAKTVNFLSVYGGGVVKLAQNLNKGRLKGSKAQLGAIYKNMFKWRMSEDEKAAWPTVTPELKAHNEPYIQSAYSIQQSIFRAAPEIKDFLKAVQRAAESRGYIRNFYGRRYYFTDRRYAYKSPNHLIQGTCADMLKFAMNKIDDYLKDKKSKLLLQIHDELVVETHESEEYILPEIKRLMEEAYVCKHLPQIAEVSWSKLNMAEKLKWPNTEGI